MRRQKFSTGLAAAAFTLSLSTAWAQDRGRPEHSSEPSRPSNGETTGSAVARDSGSASSSGSTSSGSSSSGSSASSPMSPGPSNSWMGGSPGSEASRAPVRPQRMERLENRDSAGDQRRGNGTSSGRAVPRGESGGSTSGNGGPTSASSGSDRSSDTRSRAVPTYSRPRDGRNPTGTAVERTTPFIDRGGRTGGYYRGYVYDPYYSFYYDPFYSNRYSYWSPYGYGYGLGYFSYDPFLFGGYGSSGYYGGGYDPYYGGSSGRYATSYRGAGALRLKVKPANAQVYIDGYYVGLIDSFDGAFQRLNVDGGPHKVELRAEGFDTVEFEVMITPGDTVTYKGEMRRR